jgi:hypothetical protein
MEDFIIVILMRRRRCHGSAAKEIFAKGKNAKIRNKIIIFFIGILYHNNFCTKIV